MLPSYLFAGIIFYTKHFEDIGYSIAIENRLTMNKCVFVVFILLIVISLSATCYLKKLIIKTKEMSKSKSKGVAELTGEFNEGLREFLLSVLIPVITTISITEAPLTGLISSLLLQILLYVFFSTSSELFPNVSLKLIGYSIVKANDNTNEKCITLFMGNDYKELLGSKKEVQFVYFGSKVKESKYGVSVGENK